MNHITIIGNLTKDPETRTVNTATGAVNVCDFSVAVDGKKGDQATFFRCTAWRGLGDMIAKHCSKGKKVAVSGSVSGHAYKDKDGNPACKLEIKVKDFEFCSPKGEAYDNDLKGMVAVQDEDMPF